MFQSRINGMSAPKRYYIIDDKEVDRIKGLEKEELKENIECIITVTANNARYLNLYCKSSADGNILLKELKRA